MEEEGQQASCLVAKNKLWREKTGFFFGGRDPRAALRGEQYK